MRAEPPDLTPFDVARALQTSWGVGVTAIDYAPVGFGSHHWTAAADDGRLLFVTGDCLGEHEDPDAKFHALRCACETSAALHRDLEFVLPPLPDRDRRLLVRITPDWALAVFPHLAGRAAGQGAWDGPDAVTAATLIGRLHAAPPPGALQRFSFDLPYRDELFDALDREWRTGPYGEPARRLLGQSRAWLQGRLARYDSLVTRLDAEAAGWVVTHGEPHSANFIRTPAGDLHLIDWDTVRLAPRERDLWHLPIDTPEVLEAYQSTAGPVPPRRHVLELFRLAWELGEIAVYTHRYRNPHHHTPDDEIIWPELQRYLHPE